MTNMKGYTIINIVKIVMAIIIFVVSTDIWINNLILSIFAVSITLFVVIFGFRLICAYYKDTDNYYGGRDKEYVFLSFKDFYNLYKFQKSLFDLEYDGPTTTVYDQDSEIRILFKTITEFVLYRIFRIKYKEKECDSCEISSEKFIKILKGED